MSNKNIETIDEVLEREYPDKENKKNKKGFIVRLVAAGAAAAIAIGAAVIHFSPKKNKNNETSKVPTTTASMSTTTTTTPSIFDLDGMGNELEFPTNTTQKYGEVISGDIDIEDTVVKDDTIYVNQEEANEAENIGKTSIDLKDDTLKTTVVSSNGTTTEKVYNKTTGYEIIDKTNNTTVTGNLGQDGIPDGFEYDKELDGIFEENDNVETLTYADANYYDQYGNLVLKKGDVVEKERLEYAKANYYTTTTKATVNTTTTATKATVNTTSTKATTSTTTTTASNSNGVVNEDGTYTIFGITYLSKADYEQCILDNFEGYALIDGIMQPIPENINIVVKSK